MLLELHLRNLATFEKAELHFDAGVNIFSGMSGAGKSVLLKALGLCLGEKFSQRMIREGASQCEVVAVFKNTKLLEKRLENLDIEVMDSVMVRRVCKKGGRTTNYVNDGVVVQDSLLKLTEGLASILSQDEALGLKDVAYQLDMIDLYGKLTKEQDEVKDIYKDYCKTSQELERIKSNQADRAQQRQFVEFQLAEIEKLKLVEGEFDELEDESKRLSHSEELTQSSQAIMDSSNNFQSVLESGLQSMQAAASEGSELSHLIKEGFDLFHSIEAWASTLQSYSYQFESNPERLYEVDSRLVALRNAFKKFSMNERELLQHLDELKSQLESQNEESVEVLEKRVAELKTQFVKVASSLHKKREKHAQKLAKTVNEWLEELEMDGERFSIELSLDKEKITASGSSHIQFMLKPTAKGQSQPLHEIASGGERSRALLALCSALSDVIVDQSLIFDEIDTNIGSRLGKSVAKSFQKLAEKNQLICVTHLAPVAASGIKHFLIEKNDEGSSIRSLNDKERVEEIAQMIAGERNSKEALKQAKLMLKGE